MPAPRNSNQRNQQLHPGVYRRRRIVLLIVVALILWALISGVMAVVGMVSSWFGGTPSAWYRVRSSSTGCGADQTPVDAGAYTLVATVNGVISDTNQFLIN